MASFQQTIIVGNVGGNPETKNGVCNFSVAVNEKYGETKKTTWYRVAAWDKLAVICESYVRKGMLIMVLGKVSASAYTNKEGLAVASLELRASNITLIGRDDTPDDMRDDIRGDMRGDMPF